MFKKLFIGLLTILFTNSVYSMDLCAINLGLTKRLFRDDFDVRDLAIFGGNYRDLVSTKNPNGHTLLHLAAKYGIYNLMACCIGYSDTNALDNNDNTPLHLVAYRKFQMEKYPYLKYPSYVPYRGLFDDGVRQQARQQIKRRNDHFSDFLVIARWLIAYRTNLNLKNKQNLRAIDIAASFRDHELVKLFLDNGATLDSKSPMYYMFSNRLDIIFDALMDLFSNARLPKLIFSYVYDNEVLKSFYQEFFDVASQAIQCDDLSCLNSWLKYDLSNMVDNEGQNLMTHAVKHEKLRIFKFLLEKGFDLSAKDNLLNLALSRNTGSSAEIAKLLLERGVEAQLEKRPDYMKLLGEVDEVLLWNQPDYMKLLQDNMRCRRAFGDYIKSVEDIVKISKLPNVLVQLIFGYNYKNFDQMKEQFSRDCSCFIL